MVQQDTLPLSEDGPELSVHEVLTGRGFITGKSGSGKSNTASVVVEELLDRDHPVMIVDTDGEYWGLKEQYELLHVGAGDDCDFRVGPEHGEKLAELALEQGAPIILDVSGYLESGKADEVVKSVSHALFHKEKEARTPFLLLVEEVHEYIPQQGAETDAGKALVQIAKRGRKHGLGIVGISQRPASVDKDYISQCDWVCWHRLTWDNDTDVVRRVVDSETASAVDDLGDGEAFLQADWRDSFVERVQVRRKRTFDAGERPGLDDSDRPELKSVGSDIGDVLAEVTEAENERQDRIAELESQNESLREEIERLEAELEQAGVTEDLASEMVDALSKSSGGDTQDAIEERVEEIRDEKNQRIAELESENSELREELSGLRSEATDLRDRVDELEQYESAVENIDELREAVERSAEVLGVDIGDDDRLRERLESKSERVAELEREVSRLESEGGGVVVPDDYEEFVQDDDVQAGIQSAIENSSASKRYVKGVVAVILECGGPVDYETVADYLGVSGTSNISKAASSLERHRVVKKVDTSPVEVDFDRDSIEDLKQLNRRRERADEIMEEVV
jgi:phage shock protein A